jgi:hypothetical protein
MGSSRVVPAPPPDAGTPPAGSAASDAPALCRTMADATISGTHAGPINDIDLDIHHLLDDPHTAGRDEDRADAAKLDSNVRRLRVGRAI